MVLKYYIETKIDDKWQVLHGDTDDSLLYLKGLFSGYNSAPGPRPAMRLVRTSDRKVLKEAEAFVGVSTARLGMRGASWPLYVQGAETALLRAASDMTSRDLEKKAKLEAIIAQLRELY